MIRQEGKPLRFTYSKHRSASAAAQKKNCSGAREQDHCEKNGGDGVEGSERLEKRFDFDGTVIYCFVTGGYQQRTLRTTTVFLGWLFFFRWQSEEC